jgi:hypothetical protein
MKELIIQGIIIALLAVTLGEVIRVGLRVERCYDQIDEITVLVTRMAATGRVGEVVK